MKTMLANAIALASEKHKGQFDKGGMPYILHPLKVMHYLKTDDIGLMCIAVLHDVIEDCDVTWQELYDVYGMSDRVVNGVLALTKIPGQHLDEYMSAIKANPDAIKVKLADLRHNMDARRLKGVTEKDRARLDKYAKMYWELKDLA
jgi:(p)ppGpp synthase/HD superfamily hydrolase